jgi:hypothetical protein
VSGVPRYELIGKIRPLAVKKYSERKNGEWNEKSIRDHISSSVTETTGGSENAQDQKELDKKDERCKERFEGPKLSD